jgi:hypothetical protein
MINISIPNTGYKTGTCGWLAAGLANGSIKIQPGVTKTGKGGLWIHFDGKQGCLAIFNQYNLTNDEFLGAESFHIPDEDFAGAFPLTKAAEEYLRCAAQEWCDAANSERENDTASEMPRLVIAR